MPPARFRPKKIAKPVPEVAPQAATRRGPQFSILGIFVVTLICSVASAGAYYLFREGGNDPSMKLVALLFLLAGPMLLLVIVSLLVNIAGRWK